MTDAPPIIIDEDAAIDSAFFGSHAGRTCYARAHRSGWVLVKGGLELLVPPRRGHSRPRFFGFLAYGGAGPRGPSCLDGPTFQIRPSAGMLILPCA